MWAPVLACTCTTYPCQTRCWQGLFISSSGAAAALQYPGGGFSARVPPERRSAFTNPTEAPWALLIRRVNQSATKSALRSRCPAKMSPRFRLWSPGCNDTTQPGFFFIPPTARALGNPAIDSRTPLRLNVVAKTGVGTRPRISALTDLPPSAPLAGLFFHERVARESELSGLFAPAHMDQAFVELFVIAFVGAILFWLVDKY